jgi:hypothetical protein
VVGSLEHSNEPSGSLKCGQFLNYLRTLPHGVSVSFWVSSCTPAPILNIF